PARRAGAHRRAGISQRVRRLRRAVRSHGVALRRLSAATGGRGSGPGLPALRPPVGLAQRALPLVPGEGATPDTADRTAGEQRGTLAGDDPPDEVQPPLAGGRGTGRAAAGPS